MSTELKIIAIVVLVAIGSHLLLWGFIKRKLREAEARIAKEKKGGSDDGGGASYGGDSSADCGGGDIAGCD